MQITLEDAAGELREAELSWLHWRRTLDALPLSADPGRRAIIETWLAYYSALRDRYRTQVSALRRLRAQRITSSVRSTLGGMR